MIGMNMYLLLEVTKSVDFSLVNTENIWGVFIDEGAKMVASDDIPDTIDIPRADF
jgi:hypothetical protein